MGFLLLFQSLRDWIEKFIDFCVTKDRMTTYEIYLFVDDILLMLTADYCSLQMNDELYCSNVVFSPCAPSLV